MFKFIKHVVILVLYTAAAFAGDAEEVKKTIEDDFAYLKK